MLQALALAVVMSTSSLADSLVCGTGVAVDSFLTTVRHLASSPDSVSRDRRAVYHMIRVPASRVTLVLADSLCRQAAAEYAKVVQVVDGPIAVVRAGQYWIAEAVKDFRPGVVFGGTAIFDARWRLLGTYGWGS